MLGAVDDYARRPPPRPEAAAAMVARLLEVRGRILPDARARAPKDRNLDRVRVLDDNPAQLCVTERLEDGELVTVTLPLTLDEAYPARPTCDHCNGACTHGLAALDELLDWLFDEEHPRRGEVLEVLGAPPWRRWLDALSGALEDLEGDIAKRAEARVWWSVDLEAQSLAPYVEHATRAGGRSKPRRVRLEALEGEADLGPQDRGALAAARLMRAERRAAEREGRLADLFAQTLEALVGHPRVAVGAPGGTPWRVESAPVRFSVERDGEALELDVRAGDVRLGPADLVSTRNRPRVRLFARPDDRRLLLVRIDASVARLLETWAKSAVPVPAPAQPELLARLSRAAQHLEVRSADHVREITVEPRLDLVVLATPLPDGGLQLDLRARPLTDGPLFGPGLGPEDVLASTPDRQILRATRDLGAEREAARALLEELKLSPTKERSDQVVFDTRADALDAVRALWAHETVELQWPTARWHPPVTVTTSSLHLAVRTKRDWFDLHGEAEISDRRVDLAVLIEAARRDRGYVALDDGRFAQLEASLREELVGLAPYLQPQRGGLRVSLGAARRVHELASGARSYARADAWQALLTRLDEAETLEPVVPEVLQADLRPYQREGYAWMARLAAWGAGAVLADDMGLGKTVQAIALLCARAPRGPQLVVAPTSVGFNWARELARFSPHLEVIEYAGPDRERRLTEAGPGVVFLTSYGVVQRDSTRLEGLGWATKVLDEAQAIKNPRSLTARAAQAIRADFSVALTGTPVENHPAEMWALFAAVFPGLLGTWESFRSRFLATAERDGAAFGTGALAQVIRPYVLRRTKAQVAQHLPPRTEVTVDVTLSAKERAMYDDARLAAIAEIRDREVTEQTHYHLAVLSALTRLRQLACNPRLVDPNSRVPSAKLERLMQIVHDLVEEDYRALVFSQFTRHLALVREALDAHEVPYCYLDGSTPAAKRAEQVERFQAGEGRLFLISTKAGGTGLNLTAANIVIHLDPWWNPAVEDQATDRAHRLGQDAPVTILRLVARDTIEHHMLDMNRDKRDLVNNLLEGTEAVGKLSSEALMALIRA